jgi:hypothetical protein
LESSLTHSQKVFRLVTDDCDRTPECPLYESGQKSSKKLLDYFEFLRDKAPLGQAYHQTKITADAVEDIIYSSLPYSNRMKSIFEAVRLAMVGHPEQLVDLILASNDSNLIAKMAILCVDLDNSEKYSLDEWTEKMKSLDDVSSLGGNILSSHLLIW